MFRLILNYFGSFACKLACVIFMFLPIISVKSIFTHFWGYLLCVLICIPGFIISYRLINKFEREIKRARKSIKKKKAIKKLSGLVSEYKFSA